MVAKQPHQEKHSVTPRRAAVSIFFVALLSLCTALGAIPFHLETPLGVISTEVQEAEARNTNANRLRSLSARNTGANRVQAFSTSRNTYTVNVRQSTTHANIRFGLRTGQQVRWRIDTRHATTGSWVNGSYNSWRARTTSNTNRDIRVNVGQGRERRIRFQIRDRDNNTRTITVNIRRASGNTFAQSRTSNAGTWNRSFDRAVRDYTLTIPHTRTASTSVSMRPAQERAMARSRARVQNANGNWGTWSSWSSYSRGLQTRAVGTIPQGRQAQIQIMIRGAFSNMSNSPTRTGTYTITVVRPNLPPVLNVTITFNAQGGSVSPTSRTIPTNTAIGTLPTPTRANHTFVGWFTAATGGTQVSANTTFSSNTTIHARWTPVTRTVTFNPQGGTVSPTTRAVPHGTAIGALPTPTRPSHNFVGWFTQATGGSQVTATMIVNANMTIHARWQSNVVNHTVTLNPQGGTVSPTSINVTGGQPIGTLPTPTRNRHTFVGWYTTATTGGQRITANSITTGNMTIHARWQTVPWTSGQHVITPQDIWDTRNGANPNAIPPNFRVIEIGAEFCMDCFIASNSLPVIFTIGSARIFSQQNTPTITVNPLWITNNNPSGLYQLSTGHTPATNPLLILVDPQDSMVGWWRMPNVNNPLPFVNFGSPNFTITVP